MIKLTKKSDIGYAYWSRLAFIGKSIEDNRYEMGLKITDKFLLPIYKGNKKPLFRKLYVLDTLMIPLSLIIVIGAILLYSCIIVGTFFNQCLFKKSFITNNEEKVSGYISLGLAIIGLISVIKWLI